ncbi:chemotaxis protein CheA [Sulfuricella sp. T08]|uniref:chemotaxis protein CheA n=1 Tax=Sulfuricella sp. T08 TaxID=1632857 RepID=UPI0006179872|nr:chemotaxis protein CheA [Sulfuricella sp. T08]GAO37382.1 chemotaxis protein CheA [Sulfuricella sp. T08]
MNMDDALQTFLIECRELLQAMEEALLNLESEPDDKEAIGAVFRAAHTIKGSAGLFGLDTIVAFTHVAENVLDKVRNGEVPVDSNLIALLLSSGDHIAILVEQIAGQGVEPDEATCAAGEALLQQLKTYLAGEGQGVQITQSSVTQPHDAPLQSSGGGLVGSDTWHISLRFGHDVLKNGMDPLSFLRYLATLGEIVSVTTLPDAMPLAEQMDPECCYLGFEIDFRSTADKTMIEGVFEFVRDDCNLRILPPHSRVTEYIQLINDLPEDKVRLGDILINSGVVTQKELDEMLICQAMRSCIAEDAQSGEHVPPVPPLGEILVQEGMVQKELVDAALGKQKQARDNKAQESRYIRVHADKLDDLINLVGELVIASASAALLSQRSRDTMLHEATSTMSRLVEEIRDGALQLRMVPIGETFNRFHRVVRDVSNDLGKEIGLEIGGAETELDKSVVEKIGDPLMHLVRNSMDHGIESAELRQQRGKSAKGTVRLNAFHESGSIVIEVGDDGGGLNRDKLLAKAIERGLVGPNQSLTDQEVYALIFEAGFSTADAVTSISGRGVGMDVVRRNIEALRGMIEIDSVQGVGTTIRIRLPLTLAIIDGFLLGVGSASYVVPLDMVMECIELSEAERQETRERNYINLRGTVLPFIRLRDHFREQGKAGRRENIVVVQYAGQKAGLVVDELMGEFQTVIKPLGKIFGNLRGVSGSTILGSGEVALILDVPALIQRSVNQEAKSAGQEKLVALLK